jgi:2-amino-4-hydroxy-6-hydroxymethyldihydropteridine diphosphokinase
MKPDGLVALVVDRTSLFDVLPSMDCVIGLGANLGDCQRTFTWTLEQLQRLGRITAISSLYENPAVGGPPQPDYLNGAVRLFTELGAEPFLTGLQGIELRAGRERVVPWGPRTLDLDVLWIADQVIDTKRLVVPHPRLTERAFALRPLVDVAPGARCPLTGRRYFDILEAVGQSVLRAVSAASGPPWKWHPRLDSPSVATIPNVT